MSKRMQQAAAGHIQSHFDRREQSFCNAAVESGEFDTLTDEAWVRLCETVSKDGRADAARLEEQVAAQSAGRAADGMRQKSCVGEEKMH
ncbi:MAG: hypothetical protein NTU83_11345 [Candidatus Hydrogenedentes bacterium]|nr:hypothetical protein [Candidatus Hydrogenedentota bacterium]